jgi:uncharacterized protein
MRDIDLTHAIKRGDLIEVRRMIKAGANLQCTDVGCWSPLFHAARRGNAAMIRLLVANGADVNWPFQNLYNPLCGAVFMCHLEAVKALLEAGARTDLGNQGFPENLIQGSCRDSEAIRQLLREQRPA